MHQSAESIFVNESLRKYASIFERASEKNPSGRKSGDTVPLRKMNEHRNLSAKDRAQGITGTSLHVFYA
jgi:hypothetical protein